MARPEPSHLSALESDAPQCRWFVTTYVTGTSGLWESVETIQAADESRAFAQAELVIRDHAAAVVYRETSDASGGRKIVAIRTFRNAP